MQSGKLLSKLDGLGRVVVSAHKNYTRPVDDSAPGRAAHESSDFMIFLHQNGAVVVLIALTVIAQCAGMTALIEWIKAQFPTGIPRLGIFRSFVLVVRFTGLLVCLHMLEILLWAGFYRWRLLATWEAAFYFSAANYSTVGAGDILLQRTWRLMGPAESVTGVLMCGLSASFLFAIVTRLVQQEDPALVEP
jgi:voltage-gated potassium channel